MSCGAVTCRESVCAVILSCRHTVDHGLISTDSLHPLSVLAFSSHLASRLLHKLDC